MKVSRETPAGRAKVVMSIPLDQYNELCRRAGIRGLSRYMGEALAEKLAREMEPAE